MVSIAIAPRGEPLNQYQFVKKTIHRPNSAVNKSKELDPSMQALMNDLGGLLVSPDAQQEDVKGADDEEVTQPGEKRKRSGDEDDLDSRKPSNNSPSSTLASRATAGRGMRRSPPGGPASMVSSTRSLAGSSTTAKLPTARAVFGLAGSTSSLRPSDEEGADSGGSRKRRVIDAEDGDRVYCGDANDLPDSLRDMKLT